MGVVLRRSALAAIGAAALLLAAGCGGSSSSEETTTTNAAKAGEGKTVALVSDIGKFNDRSFNQSQKEGLDRAVQKLGDLFPLRLCLPGFQLPALEALAEVRQAALAVQIGNYPEGVF